MKNAKNSSEGDSVNNAPTEFKNRPDDVQAESMNVASPEKKAAAMIELRRHLRMPVAPVPETALRILHAAALQDTGGSQACRSFLFWLVGQNDPTGYQGSGGFELRRMDGQLRQASIEVLRWWSSPTKTDEPLYAILANIRAQCAEVGADLNQLRLSLNP